MEVNMITRSKLLCSLLLVAFTGLMYGCGGGGSTAGSTPPSGKLVKGPVEGAIVFADRLDANNSPNLVRDSDEVWAQTDANGKFTLPSVPNYKYVLVSQGGKDTLPSPRTQQNAILMLAPAGSANITILTTLVALDTTGTVYKNLQALQSAPLNAALDFDVSTASTPATLLLMKSVEYAVQSITSTVSSKAALSGFTITDQQIALIQCQALQQIALEFAKSTSNLATPAGLKAALTTAVSAGLTEINKAVNIDINPSAATSIADTAVSEASALNPTLFSGSTLNISSVLIEKSLASPALFSSSFAAALSATYAAISSLTTTSGNTPDPIGPSGIIVIANTLPPGIITGSAGTGSGGGGTGVAGKPVL
jgi:hypothetical protein